MKLFLIIFTFVFSFSSFAKEKLSKVSKNLMLEILDKNEALHASFFSYKANDVESAAKIVLAFTKSNTDQLLKADIEKANDYISKISANSSEEDNKKNYGLANIYFVKIINKYDLGEKYQAYYCPMVRKKWIQNIQKGTSVQNPYDASMPGCGGRL